MASGEPALICMIRMIFCRQPWEGLILELLLWYAVLLYYGPSINIVCIVVVAFRAKMNTFLN